MTTSEKHFNAELSSRKPRLGFVGLGWIGCNRMESVVKAGAADVCAVHDAAPAAVIEAQKLAPDAVVFSSFEDLLNHDLDGVVIATPNRFHVDQAVAALDRGVAVFCQKPLGRNASETRRVVEAARSADCLLGVDLSYRNMPAMQMVRWLVQSGALGKVFGVDARFHNAYGPDKAWFYDHALAGGGCLLDLGIHLVDLTLEPLRFPPVTRVQGTLFSAGSVLGKGSKQIEDYGVAAIQTADDTAINLACSWNLHAGKDANVEISFYGTQGGASVRNVDGSFYDFVAERFTGTQTQALRDPADSHWQWGSLATIEWVKQLAFEDSFDPSVERLITVAEIIDDIYGRST